MGGVVSVSLPPFHAALGDPPALGRATFWGEWPARSGAGPRGETKCAVPLRRASAESGRS